MSEQYNDLWDDSEDNDDPGQQHPKGGKLRDFAERMQNQNRELTEEVGQLKATIRRSELSGTLAEAGYDPAVIGMVPDSVTDAEGMKSWLETNGSFLKKKDAPSTPEPPVDPATPETTLTPEQQAALDATTGAPQGAPPSVSPGDLDRLAQAKSKDEYWNIMHEIQRGEKLAEYQAFANQ